MFIIASLQVLVRQIKAQHSAVACGTWNGTSLQGDVTKGIACRCPRPCGTLLLLLLLLLTYSRVERQRRSCCPHYLEATPALWQHHQQQHEQARHGIVHAV